MKNERITVRLNDELLNDLKLVSELEGCSISFIIRTVVNDYLKYYLFKNNKTDANS